MKVKKSFVVAVSGGSGSGKTTVTSLLSEVLGQENILVLNQDHYYRDLSHLSFEEREKQNFDDPRSIDKDLLIQHVRQLVDGKSIEMPAYDFITCTRKKETKSIKPKKIVILEGIFSLCFEGLIPFFDLKLFVDVPQDIRLLRRLDRDTKTRGRSLESAIEQYLATVRPMHMRHIGPCRELADFVVPWVSHNTKLIKALASYIKS